jgi:hypothetical protein
MNEETNAAGSIPTNRLKEMFYDFGFQYYVAGRCGVASLLHPVAGNLFHHAIEMLLKGALCDRASESERHRMGHELKLLWGAFKAQYAGGADLDHDAVIAQIRGN